MFTAPAVFLPDLRLVAFLAACGAIALVVLRYAKGQGARRNAFRQAAAQMGMEYVAEKTSFRNELSTEELKQAGWIWTELEIGGLWIQNVIRGHVNEFEVALFDSVSQGQSGGSAAYHMMFFLTKTSLPVFEVYPASWGNRIVESLKPAVRAADGYSNILVRSADPESAEPFFTPAILGQLNTSDVVKHWNVQVAGTCVIFNRNDSRQQRPEELPEEYARVSALVRLLVSTALIAN